VRVLSIQRGSLVMPNPRGTTEVLPGDVMLCFGKLTALRELMPRASLRETA
jgi:ribosomal protein S6--L-glutamate ligase